MSEVRKNYIKSAISKIIVTVGGRKVFYEKLAKLYGKPSVSRATVATWCKNGNIPASKAAHIASWSNGDYSASDLCEKLRIE